MCVGTEKLRRFPNGLFSLIEVLYFDSLIVVAGVTVIVYIFCTP